jgi:uncharacterized protein (DUF1499 family)
MKKTKGFLIFTTLLLAGCSGSSPVLGVKNGKLIKCPDTPNCVNSQIKSTEHYIKPIHFEGNIKAFDRRLKEALKKTKNPKVISSRENYYRIEFTSSLFRFVDDVELYISNPTLEELIIHVRSASRIGHSDLGVNRDRVEKLRSLLTSN